MLGKSLLVGIVLVVVCAAALTVWQSINEPAPVVAPAAQAPEPLAIHAPVTQIGEYLGKPFDFEEVWEETGVDFVHRRGYTDDRHLPSANGSGLAVVDYDLDGWLDIFLLTGNNLPLAEQPTLGSNALFRAYAPFRYSEVTQSAGLTLRDYSHGIATGDFDNDGFIDLYCTCLNDNHLYRNNGDGTFSDVSEPAKLSEPRWSSGSAFLDFDGDGDLDVYVSNYARWDVEKNPHCDYKGTPIFCRPISIPAEIHAVYENLGNGEFREVTQQAGVSRDDGRGLGVIAADVNDDGHMDIYVANDMSLNFLFLGNGDGTFTDVSVASGAGYNGEGKERAGMGVDITDINHDGLPEIFVTNYWLESHTLYRNEGHGIFTDATDWAGIGSQSVPDVGWGTALEDLDNDGLTDIFAANGTLETAFEYEPRVPHRFWRNTGDSRFQMSKGGGGEHFQQAGNARGSAIGDLDNDGDHDIVLNQNDDHPAFLRNSAANNDGDANHWIRVELVGRRSNRSAVGAKLRLTTSERTWTRQLKGGGSYLSANDPRILVGLGKADQVQSLEIVWPSGSVTTRTEVAVGQSYLIQEGQ